jgi:osmoprotectant transport system permease protein
VEAAVRRRRSIIAIAAVVAVLASTPSEWTGSGFVQLALAQETVVVGSKRFNESYILAEMFAQLLEDRGFVVDRRFGLGGTLVCFEALKNGDIHVYPEYSGTLEKAILKADTRLDYDTLVDRVRALGLDLLTPLGFNNTYAIAVGGSTAERLGLSRLSDLRDHSGLRFGLTHEFLNRQDGWPGLATAYGLKAAPVGVDHGLAYQAVSDGKIDVTDVYSTDGDIEKYDLALLDDDRGYFPVYLAAPLIHESLPAEAREIIDALGGRISNTRMRQLNGRVLLNDESFATVAGSFLRDEGLMSGHEVATGETFWHRLARRTGTHLRLTFLALLAGVLIAVPLGVFVYRAGKPAKPIVYVAGVLQTIPSIALLALMIPLFGIGALPAVIALFLYALLPILRNTTASLFAIDPVLRKVAVGMGLTRGQQLRHIELPLAVPTILAGIKTAAVINIGTATLAAFIGAGGLGEPIVTGLALNDTKLILEGAIPAAVLAILTELFFEMIERLLVPRHLTQAVAK